MKEPYAHPMMPRANHDELARQNFVASSRIHLWDAVHPGLKVVYDRMAKPAFERAHGHEPIDRHDVHRAMDPQPYYQAWSSLARTFRELHWDSIGESVERQLPDLIKRAAKIGGGQSTLRLLPNIKQPRYMSAVDIHAMPGGYHADLAADDVYAGAVSDRGGYYHILMFLGGRAHQIEEKPGKLIGESFANNIVQYVRLKFPDLQVRRLLDIGCCNARNTLPYVDAFPGAEIHGIDLSAAQLRYGLARATAFGKTIHLSQQNAEHTDFPAGHFDLVVSSAVFHETARTAALNILKECHRLLRPGGATVHSERRFYRGLSPFDAFLEDWECYYDNEPFKATWRELNPTALLAASGFAADTIAHHGVTRVAAGETKLLDPERGPGAIFSARKGT
ncbi:MAG: class I SAM-dependent methyltransferase [Alphaproteobacteria bacterium]|nr:class I SAM-dependent methyltransferase [Alphaproteobacteria bacterium]